jgi:hypothetical protein
MTTQQQTALAALQSMAAQQGTFVAPQGNNGAGTGSTGGTGGGDGTTSTQVTPPAIDPSLPPPTVAPGTAAPGTAPTARFASQKPTAKKQNLKPSNARKSADPAATEPWLPDIFGGSRRLAAVEGYDSTDTAAMAAAAAANAAQKAVPGVMSSSSAKAGSNKEAFFLLPMLMTLPRLSLGGQRVLGGAPVMVMSGL